MPIDIQACMHGKNCLSAIMTTSLSDSEKKHSFQSKFNHKIRYSQSCHLAKARSRPLRITDKPIAVSSKPKNLFYSPKNSQWSVEVGNDRVTLRITIVTWLKIWTWSAEYVLGDSVTSFHDFVSAFHDFTVQREEKGGLCPNLQSRNNSYPQHHSIVANFDAPLGAFWTIE